MLFPFYLKRNNIFLLFLQQTPEFLKKAEKTQTLSHFGLSYK